MKTTFEKIKSFLPCENGWDDLLKNCNPEIDMDKEIDLMEILKSNGVKHAVWALRCFEYRDYCLFLADVAESVLPIFEAGYPEDDRPRKAIGAIRDFHSGKSGSEELCAAEAAARAVHAARAARAAAYTTARAPRATAAHDTARAAEAAALAIRAAAHATSRVIRAARVAQDAAHDAAHTTHAAVRAATHAVAHDHADRATARIAQAAACAEKWQEIEDLFIEHFGGKDERNTQGCYHTPDTQTGAAAR